MKHLLSRHSLIPFLLGVLDVDSFSVVRPYSSSSRVHKTSLAATVYGGDCFGLEADDNDSPLQTLVESLSEKCAASLARLACAFAPPGHGLHLKDLQSAQLLSVDEQHIEISAIACEAGGCVSIYAPIAFPHSCHDRPNMEDCILENIEELDHQAFDWIEQDEWTDSHAEELQEQQRLLLTLTEEPIAKDLPSWWMFPPFSVAGMVEECQGVKELLNEPDFVNEIQAMTTQHVLEKYYQSDLEVIKAAVASVGPSGVLIRAQIRQLDDLQALTDDRVAIVDLPIAFSQEAKTVEELRSFVLGLVASSDMG